MSTPLQLSFPFAAPRSMRETTLDRVTMRVLEELARRHEEVWAPTTTIADRLGITVRAAQLRIERLEALGLVRRVWDFTKRSRRRLVLLWRQVTTYDKAAPPENCADSTNNPALTEEPPLEPLYRNELSEKREILCDDDDRPGPAATAPAGQPADPGPSSSSPEPTRPEELEALKRQLLGAGVPPEAVQAPAGPAPLAEVIGQAMERILPPLPAREAPRAATPEEGRAVVEKARQAFPHVPAIDWKVRAMARRLRPDGVPVGLQWVDWALDWAVHRKAVSWKFMISLIADWCENGPSGPPVKRGPVLQNYNPLPAPGPESPPTADEVLELERLAAAGGPAARLAAAQLARIRGEAPRG